MKPAEALNIWAAACQQASMEWYLYRDTLLCAAGYGAFPDELKTAQIAVCSKDIGLLINEVSKHLPKEWEFSKENFSIGTAVLAFKDKKKTVLQVHVVHAFRDEDAFKLFFEKVNALRKKGRERTESFPFVSFFVGKKVFGKIKKVLYQRVEKGFRGIVDLTKDWEEAPLFYSDALTNSGECRYQNLEKEELLVDGVTYPVLSGYRDYLCEQYGDYQTGLFDAFGCGLTAAEKQDLAAHQKKCIAALRFVKELGEKHGLTYYLLAGNVLGAVRHGGFIPWDDDIDIGIKLEDLPRFEKLVKENLPSEFRLVQPAPNFPYPRAFSKICYQGRCCIDLWPLIPTYQDGIRAKLLWFLSRLVEKAHYIRIGYPVHRKRRMAAIVAFFLNDKQVMRLLRRIEKMNSRKDPSHYVNLYSIYKRKKETLPSLWLEEAEERMFEGIRVPVMGHVDAYLTHLYGDYMTKPAPWKRASRHVSRFEYDN